MSSVAMMTASNFFARRQRSQTCRRRGLFSMRCNGFPGKRVDCQRAGMMPTALFICRLHDDFGRRGQILSNPVGTTAFGQFVEPGPNADRTNASIVSALDVDLLAADQKRTGKIDIMVARGFEHHSRRRLAAL